MQACGSQMVRDRTETVDIRVYGIVDRGMEADRFYIKLNGLLKEYGLAGIFRDGTTLQEVTYVQR